MSDIRVPELGESIVDATIVTWFKKPGDVVAAGEAVAELETDKVNLEVIAEEGGMLSSVKKEIGETVHVGEVIGVLDASIRQEASRGVTPSDGGRTDQAGVRAAESAAPAKELPHSLHLDTPAQGLFALRATPSIRKEARERGIDLNQVVITPRHEKEVVAPSREQGSTPSSTAPKGAGESTQFLSSAFLREDEERQKMTRRRLTIAKRLVEAQHTAAHLTTYNEVDMTGVLAVRNRRKEKFKDTHGVSLGFMSFFTKATVAALKAFPLLNAEIQEDVMVIKHHYDIGVAVAAEGGLVVPVIRQADRLSFAEIETEIARLAKKARENTLGLSDLQGGTFTITNGGVFGSLFSTPILNAPQVGILGMHGIQERPVACDGQVVIRPMMYIALSYDHRIVDGAEAVQFLVRIKQLIEDPEALLLEG